MYREVARSNKSETEYIETSSDRSSDKISEDTSSQILMTRIDGTLENSEISAAEINNTREVINNVIIE